MTTNSNIQLNNENTTNTPEIVSIILLNATTILENDAIKDINNNKSTKNFSISSSESTTTKVDNITSTDDHNNNNATNLDKEVWLVNKNENEPSEPSYEINYNDSQLLAHEDLKDFLEANPDAVVITSENFPNPYPDDYNQTWRF